MTPGSPSRGGAGHDGPMGWRGAGAGWSWLVPVAAALARRPWLWPTAVRQAVRLVPPGWWRGWPPLPVPDAAYVRFRLQTAYGDAGHGPEAADVVSYLRWCRQDCVRRPRGWSRYPRD